MYWYVENRDTMRPWLRRLDLIMEKCGAFSPEAYAYLSVTMNTYTHLGLEDAVEEMSRVQEIENARKEQEKLAGKKEETKVSKKMFRAG